MTRCCANPEQVKAEPLRSGCLEPSRCGRAVRAKSSLPKSRTHSTLSCAAVATHSTAWARAAVAFVWKERRATRQGDDLLRLFLLLKAQVAKSKPKPLRIVSRRGASGELFHEAPSALEAESELSVNLVVVLHDEDRRDAVLGNGTVSHVD
jgi:hypothetical protein